MQKEHFKSRAYGTAIVALNKLDEINSVDDVRGVSGIGKKIFEKIKEYFETGSFREPKGISISNDEIVGLNELSNIWGVGPV